jgi:Type II secretion system (T2SS), protein E, N-terminal domain
MIPSRTSRIGEVLVKARVIDELQLRSAIAQHDAWGGRLAHVISEMGLAEEERIVDTIARALRVQRVRLGNLPKDPGALSKLDVTFAESTGVFPVQLRENGKVLLLAMADPSDLETLDEVSRRSRARVLPYIAGEREIRNAIARHYRGQEPNASAGRSRSSEVAPDAEEFKIVDMSGNTVVKAIADIVPPAEVRSGAPSSASDLLDEILSGSPPESVFTEEELQRLHTVQVNQEKSAKIVRAVMELLLEKGVLSAGALRSRLKGS